MISQPTTMVRTLTANRLAYWGKSADANLWTAHWRNHLPKADFAGAERGRLGRFEWLFSHYLPREGRILEAGCGTGQLVLAMRRRGWDVEGVDFSADTIHTVRARYPDIPIRPGDVTRLDVPDATYRGYVSIGVMEHDQAGPAAFLREAHRVLTDDGVALISVPTMHPLRRLKARLGLYSRSPLQDRPFYQYAFFPEEFNGLIHAAGFQVVAAHPYDGFKGIKDEVPGTRLILECLRRTPLLRRVVRPWLERSRFGHMMMYVCRKRADA